MRTDAFFDFRQAIRAALTALDASGDHCHDGGPYPGDCQACAVRAAIGTDDREIYRLAKAAERQSRIVELARRRACGEI